jgi:hypothetical protein
MVQFCPYCGVAQQGSVCQAQRPRKANDALIEEMGREKTDHAHLVIEDEPVREGEGDGVAAAGANSAVHPVGAAKRAPALSLRVVDFLRERASWTLAVAVVRMVLVGRCTPRAAALLGEARLPLLARRVTRSSRLVAPARHRRGDRTIWRRVPR